MATSTQPVPGYYVWEVPGKPVVVHLHLDLVDVLLAEVMRGFGAVPKRGAEVGGVLLGTVDPGAQPGDPWTVRVEDFEPVECTYKRGPSYLFTEADAAEFEDACARWQPETSRPAYAVGFYRSHTRDGLALAGEDLELLDRYFPEPFEIALLVKPFVTKPSVAGFFVRENGAFPEATPLEFPFRRLDLSGEPPAPRRTLTERRPRQHSARSFAPMPAAPMPAARGSLGLSQSLAEEEEEDLPARPASDPRPAYAITTPVRRGSVRWMWLPLSFIFLLLGVALGFQTALMTRPRTTGDLPDFTLGLTVAPTGSDLTVRWNRQAPAIQAAQRGVLEIEDGGYAAKPLDLDADHLQHGSVIYNSTSHAVRFRLIVYLNARLTVSETLDWKQ
jgi:hypothetical protein